MEAYNPNETILDDQSKMYSLYHKARNWVTIMLCALVTIVAVGLVFIVSSVEGTKEVKAKNSDNVKILEIWRDKNADPVGYPKEKEEIIIYKNKEYYFVIKDYDAEANKIAKWYFAYDGGFEYIFNDYKYYILSGFALLMSMFVIYINYKSTKDKEKEKNNFKNSLYYYQKKKNAISNYTQYTPDFCSYKNQQIYEAERRDIIESAGINYNDYIRDKTSLPPLEKWQKKKLKKISKIKVKPLRSSDLLQEYSKLTFFNKKIRTLPISEGEHQFRYLTTSFIKKLFSIGIGGLIVVFGFVLGEWGLGLTYATMVVSSAFSATLVAKEFVNTTLKNRYIAKADYLQEFYNIKDSFIKSPPEPEKAVQSTTTVPRVSCDKMQNLISPII